MIQSSYKLSDILPPLVEHSIKHAGEFRNAALGKELAIKGAQDMQRHILNTLFDAETKSFSGHGNRDCFYNAKTNTLVIINPGKDENGQLYGGTVFRPKDKELYFQKLHVDEGDRVNKEPVLHQKHGIVALRPEVAKEFAKEYIEKQQQDVKVRQKVVITDQVRGGNNLHQEKKIKPGSIIWNNKRQPVKNASLQGQDKKGNAHGTNNRR